MEKNKLTDLTRRTLKSSDDFAKLKKQQLIHNDEPGKPGDSTFKHNTVKQTAADKVKITMTKEQFIEKFPEFKEANHTEVWDAMMLYMMGNHKDKPNKVELSEGITYDGSIWYPTVNTKHEYQPKLLDAIWKVLTRVGGFTRGEEFDDEDIIKILKEK